MDTKNNSIGTFRLIKNIKKLLQQIIDLCPCWMLTPCADQHNGDKKCSRNKTYDQLSIRRPHRWISGDTGKCIEETALSKGELYTIITKKKQRGKNCSITAIFSRTKIEPILAQLLKIPASKHRRVKEITLDLANSMKTVAQEMLP